MSCADGGDVLVIANAELDGRRVHLELAGGRVRGCPERIPAGARVFEAGGGRVLPGLVDHHLHLFAAAVSATSVDLGPIAAGDLDALAAALRAAACHGAVRATGLDDGGDEPLDAAALDALCDWVPVRVQYRTGGLWVLNRRALAESLDRTRRVPECVERGPGGFTGRVWRGDDWFAPRPGLPPSLAPLGAMLARYGVTAVTDANPSTDPRQAAAIRAAAAAMPQRVTVMSGAAGRAGGAGPFKVLLDDAALPDPEAVAAGIRAAHAAGRVAALHCVTIGELVVALAAYESAGSVPGDRLEHAMLVPDALVPVIAALGLTVICQPAFIAARGERYRRRLASDELAALLPLASLARAGVRIAAGSDAPYGPANPWRAVAAAVTRSTDAGVALGPVQALPAEQALGLFLGTTTDPGRPCTLAPSSPADLVVLAPGVVLGRDDDPVALTVIAGRVAYRAQEPLGAR